MSQAFRDGERHGREQASKEHARMVRKAWAELGAGADIDETMAMLAKAIEKGAK